MNNFKARMNGAEFTFKSNVEIYECDCFVLNGETFYVYNREGNLLFVKPVNKTVSAFE